MTRRSPQQPPAAPNAANLKPASAPRRQVPYLFAYDIGDDRRARQVLRCLQRWRVDGQLSVHETELLPFQARELAAELLDYLDQRADSLLVCRLSRRGNAGPIHALARPSRRPQLVGRKTAVHTTGSLPGGWYLLAYDITDPARLQRIQRHAAKVCVYLQRSVYLYHGAGAPLASLRRSCARRSGRAATICACTTLPDLATCGFPAVPCRRWRASMARAPAHPSGSG